MQVYIYHVSSGTSGNFTPFVETNRNRLSVIISFAFSFLIDSVSEHSIYIRLYVCTPCHNKCGGQSISRMHLKHVRN